MPRQQPPPQNVHLSPPQDDEEEEEQQGLSKAEISLMQKILRTQLLQSTQEVEVSGSSPLYSVKSFRQLNIPEPLLKGVFAMGFDAPSRIQETALPTLMADPPVNMIAQAQSGTGKTAAFVLAALFRVHPLHRYPQVLILSPTYELAVQIADVTRQMAAHCEGIGVRLAVREERLSRGHRLQEQVVIGTPGKVFDWAVRHRHFDLDRIALFVLDEADIMISIQGHQDQCLRIHKKLSERPSPACQMLLFSATYTPEVMDFAEMIIAEPIVIRLKREEESLANVRQFRVLCSGLERKYAALANIYGVLSLGQVIVFCRTKKTAAWLGAKMTQDGHSVGYLSSDLSTEQRLAVLTRFRKGQEKVLITTNVCSRGIDIEQVTMVVNFDLPTLHGGGGADCETYLHRIGRTGRFGKAGVALNMAADERDLLVLREIEEHFGRRILPLDADDVDALESLK